MFPSYVTVGLLHRFDAYSIISFGFTSTGSHFQLKYEHNNGKMYKQELLSEEMFEIEYALSIFNFDLTIFILTSNEA